MITNSSTGLYGIGLFKRVIRKISAFPIPHIAITLAVFLFVVLKYSSKNYSSLYNPNVVEILKDDTPMKKLDDTTTTTTNVSEIYYPFVDTSKLLSSEHYALRLIHTNDIHAHYDEFGPGGGDCSEEEVKTGKCFGGAPRLKYVIDLLRASADYSSGIENNSVLVDAGDQFQGTMFFRYHRDQAAAKVMNALGYEAMTLGNHEFDEELEVLSSFMSMLNFPVVSANINATQYPDIQKHILPYTIIERHSLAIVGFTTPDTAKYSKSGSNIVFDDPVPIINNLIKKIKSKHHGVNRIIALSHMGYKEDLKVASRLDPGISLIVGGHSHTYLSADPEKENDGIEKPEGSYPTIIENAKDRQWKTLVVQSKKWGEYVGYIDLIFDSKGALMTELTKGQPIHLTLDIPQNPEIRTMIDQLRVPFDEEGKKVVGVAEDTFHELERLIDSEQPIGRLVSDAYVEQCKSNLETSTMMYHKISGGMFNSGGVRSGLRQGNVTVNDVIGIMPFYNDIVVFNITGEDIIYSINRVLETNTFIRPNDVVASTLQVSGLMFNFTTSYESGNFEIDTIVISNVDYSDNNGYEEGKDSLKWVPIENEKIYTFVSLDFLVEGKDGIFHYKNLDTYPKYVACGTPTEAIRSHISRNSPITNRMYGGNRILNKPLSLE
ncbi:hypothetical protein H4219_004482 [Mycoemilia scoparia]|uniref:5'-nucleotidase n=1 Tax=Mycoemilia scoparia TaxID=417184 RepID=A0A9W7ZW30_9FUNG|nr:hypothetical protein H4219_004482 [Mycoemilia scoparia]